MEDVIESLVKQIDDLRAKGASQDEIDIVEQKIKEIKKSTGPRDLRGTADMTVPLPAIINMLGESEDFDQWNKSR